MYLLDTNVVSELRKIKAGRADPQVADWISRIEIDHAFVSAITIQEIEHGVLLMERRDLETGARLRRWLEDDVLEAFHQRVLPVDVEVARLAAHLHVPDPAPAADALVAATAMVNDMVLVTRNTRHFRGFPGLEILNPWNPPATEGVLLR